MRIAVPDAFLVPIVTASAHALGDVRRPARLALYSAAFLPIPAPVTAAVFFGTSVRHFSTDVGSCRSLLLHASWILLASRNLSHVAWSVFTWFYVHIHSRRALQSWHSRYPRHVYCALTVSSVLAFFVSSLVVDEFMQRVVIIHTLIDE